MSAPTDAGSARSPHNHPRPNVIAIMPPPGSTEALWDGCDCPVAGNLNGRGIRPDPWHRTEYAMSPTCPLHGAMARAAMQRQAQEEKIHP